MIPKLMRDHGDVHESIGQEYPVNMMEDPAGGLFNAAMYSPPRKISPARIEYLDVIERDAEFAARRASVCGPGCLGRSRKANGI